MERTCLTFLVHWLQSSGRLPLVIRGARQVGKTWVVRHLAESQGLRLIELNFEENKELATAFSSNAPHLILRELKETLNIEPIDPKTSLLFIDEIQVIPELYAKLRWFAEKMPELAVIAAGSLFEFIFDKAPAMSVPVGRVEFMYLEPLSFEEFMLAMGKKPMLGAIHRFNWDEEISLATHNQLIRFFKEYILVGGMPAAIKKWVETQDLKQVARVQQNILETYRGDFYKYSGRMDPALLEITFKAVPRELPKKLVYSNLTKDYSGTSVKKAFDLLCRARICHKVIATDANGLPLDAETNSKFIKALFLDVGLFSASLKLSFQDIKSVDDISLINAGGVAEQVVGQLLRTLEPFFMDPELYYWQRHEKGATAEVDFVIQHNSKVVPIEVKSGKMGALKSLHYFMGRKKRTLAARIYSGMPLKSDVEVKDSQGELITYELRSIPFYLLGELHRLLD